MRRSIALVVVCLLAVTAHANAGAAEDTTVLVTCMVEGHAVFEHPVTMLPEENAVSAVGTFDCQASFDLGPPEPVKGELTFGVYHAPATGLIGCTTSMFSGTAVVEFDEPLPGGHTAMLIEFVTSSHGPGFWHHGAFKELGRIEDGAFVTEIETKRPSDGMGEYLLQTDTPEACFGDGLTEAGFGGPAALTITY